MTLLITVLAAVVSTIVWYLSENARKLHLGTLTLAYWGASIMWFVDAVVEYTEIRAAYFTPAGADMLNDAFLGFSVVALGLVVWSVSVLVRDPNGVVKNVLMGKSRA